MAAARGRYLSALYAPLRLKAVHFYIEKPQKYAIYVLCFFFPFYSGKVYRFLSGRPKIILSLVLSLCFYLGDVFVWSCPHRRGFFDQYCRLSSPSFISLDFSFRFQKTGWAYP